MNAINLGHSCPVLTARGKQNAKKIAPWSTTFEVQPAGSQGDYKDNSPQFLDD